MELHLALNAPRAKLNKILNVKIVQLEHFLLILALRHVRIVAKVIFHQVQVPQSVRHELKDNFKITKVKVFVLIALMDNGLIRLVEKVAIVVPVEKLGSVVLERELHHVIVEIRILAKAVV